MARRPGQDHPHQRRKLTVSDGYGQLSRELEAITADYEAGPDAYAENKAASDEMLREACRVEWIG